MIRSCLVWLPRTGNWLGAVIAGLGLLWRYEFTPGAAAESSASSAVATKPPLPAAIRLEIKGLDVEFFQAWATLADLEPDEAHCRESLATQTGAGVQCAS